MILRCKLTLLSVALIEVAIQALMLDGCSLLGKLLLHLPLPQESVVSGLDQQICPSDCLMHPFPTFSTLPVKNAKYGELWMGVCCVDNVAVVLSFLMLGVCLLFVFP
jgi:hypothetical protein